MGEKSDEKILKIWTSQEVKLLITVRLSYEGEFCSGKRKKGSIWASILSEILAAIPDFAFAKNDMLRKWNNLLLTYKRILQRNGKSGRDPTRWEYYEMFHEVYGKKHFVDPLSITLMSSIDESTSEECESSPESAPCSSTQAISRPKRKRTASNELMDFLKKEAEENQNRHSQQMKIEVQGINAMKDIKNLLNQMVSSREFVINNAEYTPQNELHDQRSTRDFEFSKRYERPEEEIRITDNTVLHDVLDCMKKMLDANTKRDEHSVYGEHIANKLRNCKRNNLEIDIAQNHIAKIILDLTMGAYSGVQSVKDAVNITNDVDQQLTSFPSTSGYLEPTQIFVTKVESDL